MRRIAIQRASRLRGIPSDRLFRKWLTAALPESAELTLRVVNAVEGRRLNGTFRALNYATNVLTFVYHEPDNAVLSGDIVLCAPVVAREAREQGKPVESHYAHMTIHGALHLAGMDHEKLPAARLMESRETEILRTLGYADPYKIR